MILCKICQRPIDEPERLLHREVVGWERPGRGPNDISGSSLELRERTGEVAHPSCITWRKIGMSVEQIRAGIKQESLL